MTIAALSALVIDDCLHKQQRAHPDGDLRGLAQRVQTRIGKVVAGPWQLATSEDRRWPATVGAEPLPLPMRLLQQYGGQVLRTTLTDATVAEAFMHVQQMLAQPTLFFRPDIVWRVLAAGLRRVAAPPSRARRPQVAPPIQTFRPGIREIRPSRGVAEAAYRDRE